MTTRRSVVAATGALIFGGTLGTRMAFAAAPTDRRFVFVMQRGAADGLGTLAPVGDPAFVSQRGALAEAFASAPRLDSMFALHPGLTNVAGLWSAREALFFHAVASPYRDRSHFDGQAMLETGRAGADPSSTGWLNRMLGLLPATEARAIALAATVPMALRGRSEVASYGLGPDLRDGHGRDAIATGALAAKLLSAEGGSRIAMIETVGWDTHAGQADRLDTSLRGLDGMIGALKRGLGPLWARTMVVVATEFGRTVKVNGTGGTDHGTGSMAMLLGGAVNGGRVIADWPGLSDAALYEGRDLRPTLALDAVIGSAVTGHYGLDGARAMATLFPRTRHAKPIDGLSRV